jgi:hypothetical protein
MELNPWEMENIINMELESMLDASNWIENNIFSDC